MDRVDFFSNSTFLNRTEVELYMKTCLIAKTLTKGDPIIFVTPEPFAGPDDFFYDSGRVESVDLETLTCRVKSSSPPHFTDVQFRYIIGDQNKDSNEIHFGKEKVYPTWGSNDCVANFLLSEAIRNWTIKSFEKEL